MVSLNKTGPAESDRRRFFRLGFDCPVRWNDGGADRTGWARDVSEGGLGFITRELSAPKAGQTVQVTMELDDEQEWLVDTAATVVRCEPYADGMYAVGVALSPTAMD